jgi:hypothetical protein
VDLIDRDSFGSDHSVAWWRGDEGIIFVNYVPDGVGNWDFARVVRVPQNRIDNLLWRFKRQWHRWFPEK